MTTIVGRLVGGLARAADFTQLDWVRQQFLRLTGIEPHPGTLNLRLEDDTQRQRWSAWRRLPGAPMQAPAATHCSARCYPVRIAGRIPAAVVLPEIDDYPQDKVELVAALPLRQHLSLAEGDPLAVELCLPLAAKAVLFDIDGTLVDSVGAYLQIAQLAAQPHGLEVTAEQVRHSLATGGNFWRAVVPPQRNDASALIKAMSEQAARHWPRVLREHGRLFDGLASTLDALKRRGIVLGIVSGARPEVLELLKDENILDRFDAVVLGVDVAKPKPDPEGIVNCLAQLGLAAAEAVYVGDTPLDIQASRAAGVHAVGVLTGAGDSATMSRHEPDRLIYSHAELLGVMAP